ncbi:MAG: DUF6496 domain-containing protein [Candidatus Binatia bacterium]
MKEKRSKAAERGGKVREQAAIAVGLSEAPQKGAK